jgi:positive regulator of sigma E activity
MRSCSSIHSRSTCSSQNASQLVQEVGDHRLLPLRDAREGEEDVVVDDAAEELRVKEARWPRARWPGRWRW